MLLNNRVIWEDDTTLTDISQEMSDLAEGSQDFAVVAAQDALYIGSDQPFNHRYFNVKAPNSTAGSVSVHIWNGSWEAAVDVQDGTKDQSAPFNRSGIIMWQPDRLKGWRKEETTEDIPALANFKVYNMYWVRLTFSAAFSFTLDYVGHKFAKDSDMDMYYGDLNRAKVREAFFEVPQPNWDRVHCVAAEEIIRDLRARQIIWSPNQILDPDQFRDAAAHKAAEIIYSSFGPSHEDRRSLASNYYKKAMDKNTFNVDKNRDARLKPFEKIGTGRARRT
jgi:hypothetical protein